MASITQAPEVGIGERWIADERVARIHEKVLVIDEDRAWYASLPFGVLLELGPLWWRARYVAGDRRGHYFGAMWGAIAGFFLVTFGFGLLIGLIPAIPLGLMLGAPFSAAAGWQWLGPRLQLKPLWVFRRVGQTLEPVIPRELLQQYQTDGKPYVLRSDALGYLLKARPLEILKTKNPTATKLQFASIVLLMIVIGVLAFFMAVIATGKDDPEAPAPVEQPVSTYSLEM